MGWLLAAVLAALIAILAWFSPRFDSRADEALRLIEKVNATYDYIVVGGGTAGCVLAARLSEDADVTVLLLEAGPDDRGLSSVSTPALVGSMYHSHLDWDYYTVPQSHSHAGYTNKRSFWPRGRMLGGSSNLNTMIYMRGSHHDYDRWAELGNSGWSYQDVLPYFKKSEDNQNDAYVQGGYHGRGGEVKVDSTNTMALTDLWLQAGREMGMSVIDPNAVHQEGVFQTQATLYKGERWGTSRAFIHPALRRPNLHVHVNAHATKIVIEHKRAVGVEFVRNSRRYTVLASREVVVAAGTIGSAQLLLLSGVGPRQHLHDMHIPVVADLPVGDNLHDHLIYDFQVGLQQPVSVSATQMSSTWTHLQYQLFRTGHLSSPVSHEVNLFACTDEDSRRLQWPDVQLMLLGRNFDTNKLRVYGYSQESLQEAARRNTFSHAFTCLATLLRPASRGTLRLASADPFTYPLIDPQYLQQSQDVDILLRGIRVCQRLMRTPAMKSVGAEPSDSPSRFCRHHGYDSDEYWRCMITRNAQTVYHPVGTCKMGPPSDPSAVVDPQLRVQGVEKVRVADASVMPVIVSGNTNAPVIMIAERAAHFIRADRPPPSPQ